MVLRTKPILREMLVNIKPTVDCIIGDGVLGLILDVADELGIPIIQFRTVSASSIWVYFSIPYMIEVWGASNQRYVIISLIFSTYTLVKILVSCHTGEWH